VKCLKYPCFNSLLSLLDQDIIDFNFVKIYLYLIEDFRETMKLKKMC